MLSILSSTLKSLRSSRQNKALVLCYHRIADLDMDPWKMAVSPANFYQQMQVLQEDYHVLSLQQFHDCLRRKKFPPNAVCLTFDDGYGDNFYHAAPILGQLSLPATFFIVSGSINSRKQFWWDELECLLLHPNELPPTLRISIANKEDFRYELGKDAVLPAPKREALKQWYGTDPAPTRRHELYYLLWQRLREVDDNTKWSVLTKLADWANVAPQDYSLSLPMTKQEITGLNNNPLFDIQSHTVSHAFLPGLRPEDCSREFSVSKTCLEELTKKRVSYLTYPYGAVNKGVAQMARKNSYDLAFTTEKGMVLPSSDHYFLARIMAPDYDKANFKCFLQYSFKK